MTNKRQRFPKIKRELTKQQRDELLLETFFKMGSIRRSLFDMIGTTPSTDALMHLYDKTSSCEQNLKWLGVEDMIRTYG